MVRDATGVYRLRPATGVDVVLLRGGAARLVDVDPGGAVLLPGVGVACRRATSGRQSGGYSRTRMSTKNPDDLESLPYHVVEAAYNAKTLLIEAKELVDELLDKADADCSASTTFAVWRRLFLPVLVVVNRDQQR